MHRIMHATPPPDLGRVTSLRPLLLAGGILGAGFFGVFGTWAATAPLVGATVAPAIVAPEGHRKTIQHLEGGIIAAILVREGDRVEAGAPLVRLDDTRARAEVNELNARWLAGRAMRARLSAEQQGERGLELDEGLAADARAEPALAGALGAENEQLRARWGAFDGEIAVLEQAALKEDSQIEGFQAEIASAGTQLGLLAEEIDAVNTLLAQGLERRPRLLALQRTKSQLQGTIASNRAQIGHARQAIAEAGLQIASRRQSRAAELVHDLTASQVEGAQLREQLKTARDRLERTLIKAPVAGTIVSVKVKTTGGVVAAGETILDMLPSGDDLVLEARVSPNDIDEVQPELRAQIYLTAYHTRRLPRLEGVVEQVSADRITDADTKQAYYAARIRVERGELARLAPDVTLTAGMPAEAMIVTRERTMLDYLLAPVMGVFRRGLRES